MPDKKLPARPTRPLTTPQAPRKGRGPRRKAHAEAAAFENEAQKSAISRINALESEYTSLAGRVAEQINGLTDRVDGIDKVLIDRVARLETKQQIWGHTIQRLIDSVTSFQIRLDRMASRLSNPFTKEAKEEDPKEDETMVKVLAWARDWVDATGEVSSSIHPTASDEAKFFVFHTQTPRPWRYWPFPYRTVVSRATVSYMSNKQINGIRVARCLPATPTEIAELGNS